MNARDQLANMLQDGGHSVKEALPLFCEITKVGMTNHTDLIQRLRAWRDSGEPPRATQELCDEAADAIEAVPGVPEQHILVGPVNIVFNGRFEDSRVLNACMQLSAAIRGEPWPPIGEIEAAAGARAGDGNLPQLPEPFAIWRETDEDCGAWDRPKQPVYTADQMRAYALAAAPAVSAPAWQPIDPTPEMLEAGRTAVWIHVDDPGEFNLTAEEARAVWLAMLGASPAFQAPVTALPERDPALTNRCQGVYRKFDVRRTDGSDQPGGKHEGCEYFVLDVTHDPYAIQALTAYATACEATHMVLAADLRDRYGLPAPAFQAPEGAPTCSVCRDVGSHGEPPIPCSFCRLAKLCAAQPLPEHADHVAEIAIRLRRLGRQAGVAECIPEDDHTAVGAIFTVLGMMANAMEREAMQAPSTVPVPAGMVRSDAEFWLSKRGQIIDALRAEGLTMVTTLNGVQFMRLGKIEAQADQAPAEGDAVKAMRTALDFAAGAIGDAIHTEDGLDGDAGQRVLHIITEARELGTFDQQQFGALDHLCPFTRAEKAEAALSAVQPKRTPDAVDTAPWPQITSYSGGGSRAGLHGSIWIQLTDDGRPVEYVRAAQAPAPAQAMPAGCKLVPIEPTPEMVEAWNKSGADDFKIPDRGCSDFTEELWQLWKLHNARKDWRAMLDAAPVQAPAVTQGTARASRQRRPLSRERVLAIWRSMSPLPDSEEFIAAVRRVEAAHGIKKSDVPVQPTGERS